MNLTFATLDELVAELKKRSVAMVFSMVYYDESSKTPDHVAWLNGVSGNARQCIKESFELLQMALFEGGEAGMTQDEITELLAQCRADLMARIKEEGKE